MAILRRFLLALALVLAPSLARAANYYFSDCLWKPGSPMNYHGDWCEASSAGTNCYSCTDPPNAVCAAIPCPFICPLFANPGTLNDPFCLAPTSLQGDTRFSVALLSDGVDSGPYNSEFVAGDTAYLCAGACDGTGSATYYLQPSSGTTWLYPRVAGTAGNPVSIKIYPGEFEVCGQTPCATVSTNKASWDLHLSGCQAAIGGGVTAATEDIDRQTRIAGGQCAGTGIDIGADEWVPEGAPIQPPPILSQRLKEIVP